MTELRIQFSYMMLFLRTGSGMDVLLPKALHRATITQTGLHFVVLEPGSRIWITIDGKPVTGPVTVDRRDHDTTGKEAIVNVRQLFKVFGIAKRFVGRRYLRGQAVPADLNARVELNAGHLAARSCLCPDGVSSAKASWTFPSQNYWNQPLTDRAVYQLPVPFGATCEVHVKVPTTATEHVFDLKDGTHFEIANGDLPGLRTFDGVLTELKTLYDLYDPSVDGEVDYPELGSSGPAPARLPVSGKVRIMTPEIPLCPPLDDCEAPGGDPAECEDPPP